MKSIKSIFAIGFTALLVSCSTTKETTATKTAQNRGRSNVETTTNTDKMKVVDSRTVSSKASATASANGMSDMDEKANFNQMYTDLDMNPQQIARFEKDWKNSTDSWKRANRNKTMNNYERIETQDRILKNILDDSQFESYQQWVRDHADGK